MTTIIKGQTGDDSDVDIHGATVLTDEDRAFIREQARRVRSDATEG
ncbi:hypothetical protein [Paenarthrobacter sp. JL.01a]|nr:hypothetical protein [Paenarthrobacter sp. JL.01a]UXM90738.1 hypothetical protein N5P29_15775 [Paenarthrobacter sp. JL.01a]